MEALEHLAGPRAAGRPPATPAAAPAALAELLGLDGGWLWSIDSSLRLVGSGTDDPSLAGPCADRLVGSRLWEMPLEGVRPEALAELRADCARQAPFGGFEFGLRDESGGLRWLSLSAIPCTDGAARFTGYLAICREVTESRRRQDELWTWEQRVAGFAEFSQGWYWEQDTNFRFTRIWGRSPGKIPIEPSDVLGKARWELDLQAVTQERMAAHRATLERHAPFQDFQYMLRAPDGSEQWYSISGKPIFDRSGAFAGYRGTGIVVTPQRRLQDDLGRQRAVIAAINELARGLAARQHRDEVLERIAERAMSLSGAEGAYIHLTDAAGGTLELVTALGVVSGYKGVRMAPGEGLSGVVWQSGRPLLVNDYKRWPWRSRQGFDIAAIAGVPLALRERIVGVLGVVLQREGGRFDDGVIAGIESISPLAALALHQAPAHEAAPGPRAPATLSEPPR